MSIEARLLTSREAAKALHISLWMVRKLTHNGDLVPTRIGSRLYFSETELHRFIAANTASNALTKKGTLR